MRRIEINGQVFGTRTQNKQKRESQEKYENKY